MIATGQTNLWRQAQCYPKLIPQASGSRIPQGKKIKIKIKGASVEGRTKALGTGEGHGKIELSAISLFLKKKNQKR